MTLQEFMERNTALRHAIQTGVEYEKQFNFKLTDGKHLRVGLNVNMVEVAALVKLLIDKGLITESEYFQYSLNFLEKEVKSYESALSEKYNLNIHLL